MNRRFFAVTITSFLSLGLLIPFRRIRAIFDATKQTSFPEPYDLKTLSCMAENIFPQDQTPGAIGLDIESFLALQCKTDYYKQYIVSMRRLVTFVDQRSKKNNGQPFTLTSKDSQITIINQLVADATLKKDSKEVYDFNTFIDITIEGCFSDPVHGGNSQGRAWKMLDGSLKEEWFDA